MLVLSGCSRGQPEDGGGSAPTFGTAVPDPVTEAAVVDEAVDVVVEVTGVSGGVGRCVRLRLEGQPGLAAALTGSGAGVSGRAASLVSDCGRAVRLADRFADQFAVEGGAAQRSCMRDLFVGLSASERMAVTAVVTGTGGGSDVDAAAEMAAGVAACRDGSSGG